MLWRWPREIKAVVYNMETIHGISENYVEGNLADLCAVINSAGPRRVITEMSKEIALEIIEIAPHQV